MPKKLSKTESLGKAITGKWVPASSLKGLKMSHSPTNDQLKSAIKLAGPKGKVRGTFKGKNKRMLYFISKK
jgi:hypothetical protein